MKRLSVLFAFVLSVVAARELGAQVRLPNVISDHAVLQRDRPARVWGWGNPGETVEIKIHAQQASAKVDDKGHWEVFLKPEPAGGPFELDISGSKHIKLKDIMFGDVFMASGQSNMGYSFAGIQDSVMPHAKEVLAAAGDPNLRLLMVPKDFKNTRQDDQPTKWAQSSPQSAEKFSLLGYLFGRAISDREHVAVGIIQAAYGGTPAEAWVSAEGLVAVPALQSSLAEWRTQVTSETAAQMHQAAKAGVGQAPVQESVPSEQGKQTEADRHHPGNWAASALFNAMIAPETLYTIKGAIWYQGESSTDPTRAPVYAATFQALINDWRRQWSEPDFPFIFVQLSSFMAPPLMSWGTIRNAQRLTLALPQTAMIATYDIGFAHNPHPPLKQIMADRLVLAARDLVYGEKIEDSGPVYQSAAREGAGMRVTFTHAENMQTPKAAPLLGFELAGADGKFVAATAVVDKATVLVSAPSVPDPKFVRYAWANFSDANLYNGFALPAPAFTSQP